MSTQSFKNLQDIFFAVQTTFNKSVDIPYRISLSNLETFKEPHEEMAKKIIQMQKNGASMEFILNWAEHTISEVNSYCDKKEANFEDILSLFKNRVQLDLLGAYQDVYQPILDKMQLEQDLLPQIIDASVKPPVNKI